METVIGTWFDSLPEDMEGVDRVALTRAIWELVLIAATKGQTIVVKTKS